MNGMDWETGYGTILGLAGVVNMFCSIILNYGRLLMNNHCFDILGFSLHVVKNNHIP